MARASKPAPKHSRGHTAGVVGAVLGLAAAGTAAGVAVSRIAARRVRAAEISAGTRRTNALLREDDPLGGASRPADRTALVQADDGVLLSVEEIGPRDAPLTVVFVHGYTLSMAAWTFQRRTLAAELATANGHRPDARLVFYDQRGHGSSGRGAPEHATIEQLARDLEAVLEARAPRGPVVLVGHSMGGMTVMALAAQRPELFGSRVRAALLVATASSHVSLGERTGEAAVMRLAARGLPLPPGGNARIRSLVRALFGDGADPADVETACEQVASTKLTSFAAFYGALLTVDQRAGLPALERVRVAIVAGRHDRLMPVTRARALRVALPHATFVEMPKAGHMLPWEATEVVADEVRGLLAELRSRPVSV
jgi:pimeloyl-ACP methyl ester carboxylesterase